MLKRLYLIKMKTKFPSACYDLFIIKNDLCLNLLMCGLPINAINYDLYHYINTIKL